MIEEASRISSNLIENLKASEFLQFYRTGDRSFYEEKYRKSREVLQKLVRAECFKNKRNFLTQLWIISGLYAIPAHEISALSYGEGLPDRENLTFALYSGITSSHGN